MSWQTINPATEEILATYQPMPAREVGEVITRAYNAGLGWAETPVGERVRPLREAARFLRSGREIFALLMAREMGKPLAQGRAEVEKCAQVCEYYASEAAGFLAPVPVQTDAAKSYVIFEPLGVILAIMPWNFPFWQVFRFAAPTLAAGNAALLKHAPNTTGCALAIETLMAEAGFPEGLFRALLVEIPQVQAIIGHPAVAGVTLTGSTGAGRAVAAQAGAALKKTVLELGGSDPAMVLEDADLDLAAAQCARSRLINNGQSCIAAKRFIVVETVREGFENKLVEHMRAAVTGDPCDERTSVGPLARRDLWERLDAQVRESVDQGARVLLGANPPSGRGFFYPPTILTSIVPGMPAADEELFGPVAAIMTVKDEAEAVALANRTPYGLGASVFTRDAERGERLAAKALQAGSCFVNALVRSDPRLPFGGIKQSGYGRELGPYGIREFTNIKTVSCW